MQIKCNKCAENAGAESGAVIFLRLTVGAVMEEVRQYDPGMIQ
jgi:hypothetical protein